MSENKIHDVNARLALAEYERKEQLRNVVDESAWHYYLGGLSNLVGMLVLLLILVRSIYIPGTFYYWSFCFFIFILTELNRQNNRFKAFVKLSAIEKEEKNGGKPFQSTINNDFESPSADMNNQ